MAEQTTNPRATIKVSEAIREATLQTMATDRRVIIIGEGVPDPKGIFGTTLGLREKFGKDRVFDMPVSENALTGICIGAALNGLRPILTHQRADFSLLSLDQIINNAAKWHFMFGGKKTVPIVIRMMIGMGWGQGPQHSQSLQALFAQVPGLKVVMPTTPYDAKGLLLASIQDNNPVIFLEHRWIHNITGFVPEEMYQVPLGKAKIAREGTDVTLVAHSYPTIETLRAADVLAKHGISAEVVDLRTIRPLDKETIFSSIKKTGRVVVIDNAPQTGSIAENIVAEITTNIFGQLLAAPVIVACPNYPAPTSFALSKNYYPTYKEISESVFRLLKKDPTPLTKEFHEETTESPLPHDIPDPTFSGPF
ncbi:MAG: transketolase C-terminal domain-containing protein [bacterium]|nr:transketolase C-terminal domain-containing protein [bacterium]